MPSEIEPLKLGHMLDETKTKIKHDFITSLWTSSESFKSGNVLAAAGQRLDNGRDFRILSTCTLC